MHPRQLPPCRLDRRQVVCALFAAALPAAVARPARAQDGNVIEFVRKLYVRQVALHAGKVPARGDAFYSLFARDLRTLMQAPRRGSPRADRAHPQRLFSAGAYWPGNPLKSTE
jgi:hypothetical protein